MNIQEEMNLLIGLGGLVAVDYILNLFMFSAKKARCLSKKCPLCGKSDWYSKNGTLCKQCYLGGSVYSK